MNLFKLFTVLILMIGNVQAKRICTALCMTPGYNPSSRGINDLSYVTFRSKPILISIEKNAPMSEIKRIFNQKCSSGKVGTVETNKSRNQYNSFPHISFHFKEVESLNDIDCIDIN